MNKTLNLTKEQNKKIYVLRLKALSYKLESENLKREWEKMNEWEKNVRNSVLADDVFTYEEDCPRFGIKKGDRLTEEFDAYLMGEKDYIERYLPAIQKKWVELYNLHYEVNYTPVWEYRKAYLDALKDYRKTSVEFLRILGKNEVADEFDKILKGYIPDEYANRLDAITDQFIFGSKEV